MALGAVCCVRACVYTYIVHTRTYVGCSSRNVQLMAFGELRHRISPRGDMPAHETERYSDRCDGLGDIKYDQVLVVFAW